MKQYSVEITTQVEVRIDESLWPEQRMEEFRKDFYPFRSLRQHADHVASAYARGIVDSDDSFMEGYGILREAGITIVDSNTESEVVLEDDIKPKQRATP